VINAATGIDAVGTAILLSGVFIIDVGE